MVALPPHHVLCPEGHLEELLLPLVELGALAALEGALRPRHQHLLLARHGGRRSVVLDHAQHRVAACHTSNLLEGGVVLEVFVEPLPVSLLRLLVEERPEGDGHLAIDGAHVELVGDGLPVVEDGPGHLAARPDVVGDGLPQHTLVVLREDLSEALAVFLPVVDDEFGALAAGAVVVLVDEVLQGALVLQRRHGLQIHHLVVDVVLVDVEKVCDAAAHAGSEVLTDLAKNHYQTTSHVLASVVANALHYSNGPAIPHCKPLGSHPRKEGAPVRRAIQTGVANNDVAVALIEERRVLRRPHHNMPPAQPLARVVVGIPLQVKGDPGGQPCAEGLASTAAEAHDDGAGGHALGAVAAGDLVAQNAAHGAIDVPDGHVQDGLGLLLQRPDRQTHNLTVDHFVKFMVLRHSAAHARGNRLRQRLWAARRLLRVGQLPRRVQQL
mmetsp:Transcript_44370/g.110466  ORF Transcript_44370/g.110466 Transcript_44370/m.110466 type:complete len:439 (-) Transcript_44370:95-1411(-)